MTNKTNNKVLRVEKIRRAGKKADIFFDSIDYEILSSTQAGFKKMKELSRELNIAPHNLQPHIRKLVKINLLDGVLDKTDNQFSFTCYYKVHGGDNEWNFLQDNRTIPEFLNAIFNYIAEEKFDSAMDREVQTSEPLPTSISSNKSDSKKETYHSNPSVKEKRSVK